MSHNKVEVKDKTQDCPQTSTGTPWHKYPNLHTRMSAHTQIHRHAIHKDNFLISDTCGHRVQERPKEKNKIEKYCRNNSQEFLEAFRTHRLRTQPTPNGINTKKASLRLIRIEILSL